MPERSPGRRRNPTQARARESRERILAAAADLFAARGVSDTSTNRIAAHAGMSIGSLYRYFGDKDEIAGVLRARLPADLEERFAAAVLAGLTRSPRDAVAAGMYAILEAVGDREELVRADMLGGWIEAVAVP
ncbi:TetR/AcrR family transcriptional regulator [Nocardia arizonensis]|uniref:TetR/AcrR family transcriptional regulator n=1 Tax=Nocardia arizonensis TaxID=1141647 RepID=UPI0006D1D3AE|nr:TetR/AcrR family transcriptional regulator [Nocardia arizonensis]